MLYSKYLSRLVLLTLVVAVLIHPFTAAGETLRCYDPDVPLLLYTDPTVEMHVARFDLAAPGFIEQVMLLLVGDATANAAVLHLYGYEGGAALPAIGKDLIEPLVIDKEINGKEAVLVKLPRPVFVDNNQVFIGIDNLKPGVSIVSDSRAREARCINRSGERYFWQYLKGRDQQWRYGVFAYALDLEIHYTDTFLTPALRDVTIESALPDSLNFNSVAWADVDENGRIDLLADGRLFLNTVDAGFREVTADIGLSGRPGAGAFIDMDNDGRSDVLFIGSSDSLKQPLRIFYNRGNMQFREQELRGLTALGAVSSFSIADFNNDAYPDIFIASAGNNASDFNRGFLFVNTKGSGFKDSTTLLYSEPETGVLRGASWVDFDSDGDPDLFVSSASSGRGKLWENRAASAFGNVMERFARNAGLGMQEGIGVGGDWADYDNDGDLDLLQPYMLSARHTSRLHADYILPNEQRNAATAATALRPAGLAFDERLGAATWGDVNNDGLLDIYLASGDECHFAELYIQRADHSFALRSHEYGLHESVFERDGMLLDFDYDGRLDLVCCDRGRLRLLRNESSQRGNYVKLRLKGLSGNKEAIGALVRLYVGDIVLTRSVTSGRGLLMQDPKLLHFGLGANSVIDSAVVQWPHAGERLETFSGLHINGDNLLEEGRGLQRLRQAHNQISVFPNPFTSKLHFNINIDHAGKVLLAIYSLDGREIARVIDGVLPAGSREVQWDAANSKGLRLPPGSYVYRLYTPDGHKSGIVTCTK